MTDAKTNNKSVCSRLLRAATQEFARRGRQGASLRAICSKARCNVALVKYHFKSKSGLYREVIASLHESRMKEVEATRRSLPPPEPGDHGAALRAWVTGAVSAAFSEDREARLFERIRMHEMIQPTRHLDFFVEQHGMPMREALVSALCQRLSCSADDPRMLTAVPLVIGLVHMSYTQPVLDRLGYGAPRGSAAVTRFAAEVAAFVDRGVDGLSATQSGVAR